MGGHIRHVPTFNVGEEFQTTIMTPFGLLDAHEFHQFGLRLNPILVGVIVVSVARLVDLVSADSYLVL